MSNETKDVAENTEIDLGVLFNENTSEEAKAKIKNVFEAAVQAAAAEMMVAEEAKRDEVVEERVAEIAEAMEEQVDKYLSYVAEQWLEDNEIAIESGFKVDMAESLIEGLAGLFAEHNLEIPEDADNVVEGLIARNEELAERLNEATKKSMALAEELEAVELEDVLEELSDGLTSTQTEKLRTLAEGIRYKDVTDFAKKLTDVKEAFFKEQIKEANKDPVDGGEALTETKKAGAADPEVEAIMKKFRVV